MTMVSRSVHGMDLINIYRLWFNILMNSNSNSHQEPPQVVLFMQRDVNQRDDIEDREEGNEEEMKRNPILYQKIVININMMTDLAYR